MGYVGIIRVLWGYIGIMEKKMETTIRALEGLWFRVLESLWFRA